MGSYIGTYEKPLFERGLDELIFRAAAWATGTQIVRFSKGANTLIQQDREQSTKKNSETIRPNPKFKPEIHAKPGSDVYPLEVFNQEWSIVGVARKMGENETILRVES